jgi:hypothetical protein
MRAIAAAFEADGAERVARWYAIGPARVQFQNKNPRGWAEFAAALAQHSSLGAALTMRGIQAGRPSLYALRDKLAQVRTGWNGLSEACRGTARDALRTVPSAT